MAIECPFFLSGVYNISCCQPQQYGRYITQNWQVMNCSTFDPSNSGRFAHLLVLLKESKLTPPKINMEREDDGFQKAFPGSMLVFRCV